ncbi:IRAK1 [Cordylochernes scorpioides]|uniref:non-specific serine/threonine protein kinase n=1 Tax=Cordylochernes scorpioides TaxID=51811 RepID=A0ABY6KKY2_9ARAC|nr:IRAK1 [Cordylochernes scorpioides]
MGDILCVPFEEIVAATDNFNERNVLGKGGFGIVYKGTWKKNTVAIKCLKLGINLGAVYRARIDNILNLYGVCLREDYPCLIYQFMPNGSLEDRLLCKVSQCCVTLFFSP